MVTIEQSIIKAIETAATKNFENVALVAIKYEGDESRSSNPPQTHSTFIVALWHIWTNRYSTHYVGINDDDNVVFMSGDYDLTMSQLSEAFDNRNS